MLTRPGSARSRSSISLIKAPIVWLHPANNIHDRYGAAPAAGPSCIMRKPSRIPGILEMFRTLRSTRGNAVIEFAFVFPVMFALFVGILEFSRVFYIRLTLLSAVREASRFTVTGNVLPDPENPGGFLSRVDSIVQSVQNAAPGLDVDTGSVTIIGPNGPGDPGGPDDVVTIQVDYDIDLLTPIIRPVFPPDGRHHYTVAIMTQNEPFQ